MSRRRRLGELLLESGLLDEVRLKAALAEQRKWGGKLGRTLVEMGFVNETTMVEVLAQQLSLKTIDLDGAKLPEKIATALRLDLAERYGVFPISSSAETNVLELATSDPTNVEALQELEFATNQKVVAVVTTASGIDRAIRRYYFGENTTATQTATPQSLGVAETTFELDQLLGGAPSAPRPPGLPLGGNGAGPAPRMSAPPAPPPPVTSAAAQEMALLREQVDTLEKIVASQVRALRSLLEIMIESGLISREEYLTKLHKPE